MWKKYYEYIYWLVVMVLVSYNTASFYARNQIDWFYFCVAFISMYIALRILHEKVLKNRYKGLFTRIFSNPPKDTDNMNK